MTQGQARADLQTGRLKELVALFAPILLMTFSNYFFLLVEKLFLARFSVQAMEAAVSAAYVIQIFQGSTLALAMMAQVFVGRWKGAKELQLIGPGIWQFIWFSLLSMIIIVPLSLLYGDYYFKGTAIQEIVRPYYHFLIGTNFLYPLAATLTCFYLGQGKTRLILFTTIGSLVIKLVLAYFLIFGLNEWIPPLGLIGGALSTFISLIAFCGVLIIVFLSPKNNVVFHTWSWTFRPILFWECIHPGILRAFNRILSFLCWASIAHLMSSRGGDYLLILSVGGSLYLFLPFLGDAICQAQTTIVSMILGSKSYYLLGRSFKSGVLLIASSTALFGIPLLFFPSELFHYLFPTVNLEEAVIIQLFLGIWVSSIFYTFCYLPISYILAYKDTKFSLFMGFFNWINGYLLMYVALEVFNITAAQFWLVLSLMYGSSSLLYVWRMKWLESRLYEPGIA